MPQPKNGKAKTQKKKLPAKKVLQKSQPLPKKAVLQKKKKLPAKKVTKVIVENTKLPITQKLFTYTNEQGKVVQLTPRQYKFCLEYLSNKGLGIEAVIAAGYNCYYPNSTVPNRKAAASIAYENLMKPYINDFLNLQLAKYGFSDENVELQHLMLIHQNSDLATKKGAIDMYYKRYNKYPTAKIDINHTFDTVEIENYGAGSKKDEKKL